MDKDEHLVDSMDMLTQQTASLNVNTTKQTDEIIRNLSKLSFGNYNDKYQSTEAACYACCRVFPAEDVEVEMTKDDMTIICPDCMVDCMVDYQKNEATCNACCRVFPTMDVVITTEDEMTAICPNCMVDSVLFDCNNIPIKDADFLKQANEYWFVLLKPL